MMLRKKSRGQKIAGLKFPRGLEIHNVYLMILHTNNGFVRVLHGVVGTLNDRHFRESDYLWREGCNSVI